MGAGSVEAGLGARQGGALAEVEAALIQRAKGDPAAFGQLYEAHYGRILNYIFRRTLSVDVAEELTSNVFFKALRALPKYRHRGYFRAWLYRIATNEVKMHWRRKGGRPLTEQNPDWDDVSGRVHFNSPGGGAEIERQEKLRRYAQVQARLRSLPERYQAVLVLRYFEGLPIAEIAAATGKRTGTVKSLIHRGLKRLHRLIAEEGATFGSGSHYP